MDLTVELNEGKLNIRTSVLIKRDNEWLVHQGKNEVFATSIGGRIQMLEDSKRALIREIHEELNLVVVDEDLKFQTLAENFFSYEGKNYHELLFIYLLEITDEFGDAKIIEQPDTSFDFFFVTIDELKQLRMKPELIKSIMLGEKSEPHVIIYDENFIRPI